MEKSDLSALNRIMQAGKREFLQKGFKDASLRSIVKAAGLTTGAFYGYFSGKEALFHALVVPAADGLMAFFLEGQKAFSMLPAERQKQAAYDYSTAKLGDFIDYIYEHFDAFRLLVRGADGTEFSRFIHDLAQVETEYTVRFIENTQNQALANRKITVELIHILSSAYFSAVFEIVEHDMKKGEAVSYIDRLQRFFTAGWRSVLEE